MAKTDCAVVGVNVFAFTETDEGIFIVNRKQIGIEHEVAFDHPERFSLRGASEHV